jgi:Uma2 family endonuclease
MPSCIGPKPTAERPSILPRTLAIVVRAKILSGWIALMATTVQIPLAEHLNTDYRPDHDYVDGELEERNGGQLEHSAAQKFFITTLFAHEPEWVLEAFAEIRIQVGTNRIRVADVAIRRQDEAYEPVLTHPPLAVVEVLSPEDRIQRYRRRLDDYRDMGIPVVWVVDPLRRAAYEYTSGAFAPIDEFHTPGTNCRIPVSDLWARLDTLSNH